ncbi:MAG: MFS transporter, partial [Actinomycetota bacterium]|nr:MFS transporter [Actinomycetota bacterium]
MRLPAGLGGRLEHLLGPGWTAFAGIFVVTNLGLLAVGATLPVLPRFVSEELNGSEIEVAIVTGAFALTGLICRPVAGNLADRRGRRVTVIGGALLAVIAGALLFLPASIPGLIVSRLFLGAGEGTVFTAGSAWVVDMAPAERRGRMIGLYGLAIWTGLTLGPPVGELLLRAGGYELVWAFATIAPIAAAAIAARLPEGVAPGGERARGPLISREAAGPG